MNNNTISPREVLDLHEIISFKVLCATKAATINALVQDEELKNMMDLDVKATKEHLNELKDLISNSNLLTNQNT